MFQKKAASRFIKILKQFYKPLPMKLQRAIANSNDYPEWARYITNYWNRKEDWALAYRDALTHGHQTNNYSEITVRLFKDVVLNRNKAYNAIALIDFSCTLMEEYYQRRLRNFVNGRDATNRLFLTKQLKKIEYLQMEKIKKNQVSFMRFLAVKILELIMMWISKQAFALAKRAGWAVSVNIKLLFYISSDPLVLTRQQPLRKHVFRWLNLPLVIMYDRCLFMSLLLHNHRQAVVLLLKAKK